MPNVTELLHNNVIPYNAIKLRMPNRQAFLALPEVGAVDDIIKAKSQLMFLPTYLMETHIQDVKYEKALYKIILMGVLRDGRRVNVILDDINPYFEVQLPDTREEQDAAIDKIVDLLESDEITTPVNKSIINAKPFKYYRENKAKFLRLYYTKTKNRVAAIHLLRKNGFTTTSDDLASYYRVVCRDYLTTFSSWATLENYKSANVDMLKGTTYRVSIKNYKAYTGEITGDLLRDKTMSCCWDIETWSKDGDIPVPDNKNDNIFCLSMTFQWVNDKDPFLKVCLCDYPANAKEGYVTIVCGNEKNIIKGFAEVFELMRPEFIFGFNDSDYDWNWVIKRAAQYKGMLSYVATKLDSTKPYQPYTDDGVFKWNFKKEHVKVEADTYIDGFALMVHGYIPVDVRTIFRRLYPTAEQSSLKWFLAKNKLGGKEDMPYEEMFRIYKQYREFMLVHSDEADEVLAGKATELPTEKWGPQELELYKSLKKRLMDINYYCVVDAQRCHDLMKIRSVVMDHREVSNLAYCSVYDAFFRANGMKVRNLTIAIGQGKHFGMRFSNIANEGAEEGKYPGAFVLPPRKGLKITKLSVQERIRKAELTKNMPAPACQEWLNTTQEEVNKYHKIVADYGATGTPELVTEVETKLGEKLPKKFKDFWLEPIGRPITGLDFSSLYPSLIRTYNFSPEYCILDKKQAQAIAETGQKITKVDFDFHGKRKLAYFVWHNNKYNPEEPGFQFGVYPYILDDLFKKRAILKKQMKKFDHRKEEIEAMSPEEQLKLAAEYEEVVFNKNYLNCKQNALKVFMNTFYGEAGNKRSPFFVMEVAGGITTYGQKNIKFAYAFVKEKGCGVYYGDSVTADTPVFVRRNGKVKFIEIQDLVAENSYEAAPGNKEVTDTSEDDLEVWSDTGFIKVNKVIRHKTDKKIYEVLTHTGVVRVTEDHSLLDENKNMVTPNEISIGVNLLHHDLPASSRVLTTSISEDEAWVIGLFVAEGNCDVYQCPSGVNASWCIDNQNLQYLNKAKQILERVEPQIGWRILDQMHSNSVYRLSPYMSARGMRGKITELVEKYRNMCYYKKSKIVPACIFRSSYDVKMAFFEGYYMGDGMKSGERNRNRHFMCMNYKFGIKSQLSAASFCWLARTMGFKFSICDQPGNPDFYIITLLRGDRFNKNPISVKKITEIIGYDGYVYDLETESHHFSAGVGNLVLHNTDSLYLSMPERYFKNTDIEYYTSQISKSDYWTKCVEITFKELNPIRDGVNKAFIEDNGTTFLSMAYEEILYPVAFTAKKKYFGIAHENIPNFKPKDLFIRGLEVKKRGVSELLRKIFMEIMWTACNPENIYDLVELVLMKIDEIYARKWTSQDFIQTGVYRPGKDNVKIKTFVTNMKQRDIDIKPNERFNYVIIKKYPYMYDLRGRKVEISIGDKLELAEEFEKHPEMEIDLDYYMQGSINGQLARLITYHEMFRVEPADTTDEELKIAEDRIYKNACKFIDSYCSKYYANYNTFGKTHQKIFKTASKSLGSVIKEQDELVGDLLTANVNYDDFETWFVEYTEKKADKAVQDYGREFVNQELNRVSQMIRDKYDMAANDEESTENKTKEEIDKEIKDRRAEKLLLLQKSYYGSRKSILDQRELNYRNTMSILRKKLRENHEKYMKAYSKYNHSVEDVMELMRGKIGGFEELLKPTKEAQDYKLEDFEVDNFDEEVDQLAAEKATNLLEDEQFWRIINDLKILHNNMLSAHLVIKRTRDIVSQLKIRRDHAAKVIVRPNEEFIKQMVQESAKSLKEEVDALPL